MNRNNGQNLTPGQCKIVDKVVRENLCVQCGACVGGCPYFNYFDGRVVLMDRCRADESKCIQICPGLAAIEEDPLSSETLSVGIGKYDKIIATRATNQRLSTDSQNGGTVSRLLIHALETNMINSAIVTDTGKDSAPAGRWVHTRDDILAAGGARYSASAALSALNQALKTGADKIGVVGLPCQMQALKKLERISNAPPQIGLKIGLFCTWALDYRQFASYLKSKGIASGGLRIEIPPPPAEKMIVKTKQETHELPLSEIRRLVQPGCALCRDMTACSADISVGAYEGRTDDKNDWNTVIIRTETGKRLYESAISNHLIETRPIPDDHLSYLKKAACTKMERGESARKKMRHTENETD